MNIRNIISEIKRENKEEKIRIKERISQAVKEVQRLKEDFLKIDKNIEKIILFGSLAENSIESTDFDIDIAIKSDKYYQLEIFGYFKISDYISCGWGKDAII